MALIGIGAVLAAAFGGGWQITQRFGFFDDLGRRGAPPELPPVGPDLVQPPPPSYLTAWVVVLFATTVVLFLAVLLWMLRGRWRRVRRHPRDRESAAGVPPGTVVGGRGPDLTALRRGAEAARSLLDEPGEPRDVIVRCWLALEDAAARSGAARRPADSPTEFTATVLAGTTADAHAVDGLLHLYHRARFSRHEIGLPEIAEARTWVRRLAGSWATYEGALRATARP